MTTITIYRDTTRDAVCVEPADLDAFDAQWPEYLSRVRREAERAGFAVEVAGRSAGCSYTVDNDDETAHQLMMSDAVDFWA